LQNVIPSCTTASVRSIPFFMATAAAAPAAFAFSSATRRASVTEEIAVSYAARTAVMARTTAIARNSGSRGIGTSCRNRARASAARRTGAAGAR
jgi:hypothetical protein